VVLFEAEGIVRGGGGGGGHFGARRLRCRVGIGHGNFKTID
jgi:hypothetical protein